MTAAKGRPRKVGAREPSGKLQRPLSSKAAVTAVHRDMDIIRARRMDAWLGSPFGRLLREEKITVPEYAAGARYRQMRHNMDRLLGAPSRNPKAMDLHGAKGASLAEDRDPEIDAKARKQFERAEALLGEKRAGGMWWVVDQLCVHDIPLVGHEQFLTLKRALSKLVESWGMRA